MSHFEIWQFLLLGKGSKGITPAGFEPKPPHRDLKHGDNNLKALSGN